MTHNILVISFLLSCSLAFGQQDDPVLFTVNKNPVHVSEFDYIYKKNNGDKADYSQESLEEYLDLYIKFKLKVEKAKQLKLDTLVSLQKELAGYRKQLANAYLVDRDVTKTLVDEAYDRKLQDVNVRHLLVTLAEYATKEKESEALDRIYLIKEKVDNGADFGLIARTLSDDSRSAKLDGDLGWLTAILPNGFYGFENAIYTLPIGKTSQPIRTKLGYHLIQVLEKRPARGQMNVSHILIRKSNNGVPVAGAREKADSLFLAIEKGASFEQIARDYSDDKGTSKNGGGLGFFGIGMYDKAFEDAAFSLQEDGQISLPIESKVGWHIIRRESIKDYTNEKKMKSSLKSEISQNDRFDYAREKKIESIKEEAGFTEDRELLKRFAQSLNQSFYSYKWQMPEVESGQLASYGHEESYTIKDFADYCKQNGRQRMRFDKEQDLQIAVAEMYDSYIDDLTVAYEEANLERKYPDFKALMREYSEGVLLFEVTKDNVWDKASQDTVGLQAYFDQHRDLYQWKDRAETTKYIIETTDKDILKKLNKVVSKLKDSEAVKDQIESEFGETVFVEDYTYEKGNPEIAHLKWKEGQSEVLIDKVKNEATIKHINQLLPARAKTLKEARGYIISDYQTVLEKQWVNTLKEEFKVDIRKRVLSSLVK